MCNNLFKIFFFLIILFSLSSCSSIYMPNVPATPMFKNQGEGYVAAHVNIKGNLSGSLGLAITDHIAVLASGSTIKKGELSNDYFKQWIGEGALGYYTKMGKSKLQVLEIYGGYGIGNSQDIDQRASVVGFDPVESRLMDFNKIFIQVNYSSTRRKKINLFGEKRELNYGTAIRLSRVAMTNFMLNELKKEGEENLFIEPVFFTRMQLVKGLQLQYTTGFNVGVVSNEYLKAGNAVFTLGLTYNFGKK